MSKELEALGRLASFDKKCEFISKQTKDDFRLVEQALERNEPMKPLLKDMGFEHYDIYCPSCKEYIGFRNSVRESLTLKYCPECGQKLD